MGTFNLVFAILSGRMMAKWKKQKRLQRGIEADLLALNMEAVAPDHGTKK